MILAGIWLTIDQRQSNPLEFYDWQRWWLLLLMSGYSASALVALAWLVSSLARLAASYLWPSRKQPAVL